MESATKIETYPSDKYEREEIRQKFLEFFEDADKINEIIKIIDNYPDESSLPVDYKNLTRWFDDLDFSPYVLHNPNNCFEEAEQAIIEAYGGGVEKHVHIDMRLKNISDSLGRDVREIRARDMNKYISIEGLVRKSSDVRPLLVKGVYLCQSCNKTFEIKLDESDDVIDEPVSCPNCGTNVPKTTFTLLKGKSDFINYQRIEIQENPEDLRGGEQPQRLTCWARGDLVGQVSPGDRVILNGIIKPVPKRKGKNKLSRVMKIELKIKNITIKEFEFEDLTLEDEDKKRIKEASDDPDVFVNIVDSIAPSIKGLRIEKMGLALQLFGGVSKTTPDDSKIRGNIHMLMVGDPGTAKSQLLRYIAGLSPRGMFTSGKGATGAGLTAAAVREEIMGKTKWVLEAGTLVLSDKGLACIDELDKMRDEDRSHFHEAMEQQTISISKAGEHATLNARCSILSAANPKYGRFEDSEDALEQIKLPPTLISRFDLIFAIRDLPDESRDREIARHILKSHFEAERMMNDDNYEPDSSLKAVYDKEFLRKYVSYAKTIVPEMRDKAHDELREYYLKRRDESFDADLPVTPRQLESLVRLAEASAKARLSEKVTTDDAKKAITVTEHFINQIKSRSWDYQGGDVLTNSEKIDADLNEGDKLSRMGIQKQLIHIVRRKSDESQNNMASREEVIDELVQQLGNERDDAEKAVNTAREEGKFYEPERGYLKEVSL